MRRRTFLIGVAGAAAAGAGVLMNRFIGAAPRLAKRQKLKMPDLIDANKDGKAALAAMTGTFDFGTGVASQTLGYNGAYLGPAIRRRRSAALPPARNGPGRRSAHARASDTRPAPPIVWWRYASTRRRLALWADAVRHRSGPQSRARANAASSIR
jgi:hypothetical protein